MTTTNTPHEIRRFYFGNKLYVLEHSTWCDSFTLGELGSTVRRVIRRNIAAHILGRSFSHFASK
jgi:hypothetical protein